jgi:hypothetical protein
MNKVKYFDVQIYLNQNDKLNVNSFILFFSKSERCLILFYENDVICSLNNMVKSVLLRTWKR